MAPDNKAAAYELGNHWRNFVPLLEGLKNSPHVNQQQVKYLAQVMEAAVSMLRKELQK